MIRHDLLPCLAGRLIPGVISRGNPGGVYLTFDDGPDAVATPLILDILRQAGVAATFFVTGERAARRPDIVRRTASEGHTIGSHGFSHKSLVGASKSAIRDDLALAARAIASATGSPPRLFRPPYGRLSLTLLRTARELGLEIVLWSRSARDWKPATREQIAMRIGEGVGKGDILVLHDSGGFVSAVIDALPEAIRRLQERFPLRRL